MATKLVKEWSTTSAGNAFAPADGGWPEGMERRQVNDAARNNLAAVKDWYLDSEWINPYDTDGLSPEPSVSNSNAIITIADFDAEAWATANRRVRLTTASDVFYAVIGTEGEAGVFAAGDTKFTIVEATDTIPVTGIILVEFHSSAHLPKGVWAEGQSVNAVVPAEFTGDAIWEAIKEAYLADGGPGTVYLEAGTYILDDTLSTGTSGVVPITLVGRGIGATILKCVSDVEAILKIESNLITIKDLEIAGPNVYSVDTSGFTNGHGILVEGDASHLRIDGVYISGTVGNGIDIEDDGSATASTDTVITKCVIHSPGAHGIYVNHNSYVEPNAPISNFIHNVHVVNPGVQDLSAESRGISVDRGYRVSNVVVDGLDNDASIGRQTGIYVKTGSHIQSTGVAVTDFHVSGDGKYARGVYLGSSDSSVSNGRIELDGTHSTGIRVDSDDSGKYATENSVSDLSINCGGTGVYCGNYTTQTFVSNVKCRSMEAEVADEDFVTGGDYTSFNGCESYGGSGTGAFVIETTSTGSSVISCLVRTPLGGSCRGVHILGGNDHVVSGNSFYDLDHTAMGIEIASGSNNSVATNFMPGHPLGKILLNSGTTSFVMEFNRGVEQHYGEVVDDEVSEEVEVLAVGWSRVILLSARARLYLGPAYTYAAAYRIQSATDTGSGYGDWSDITETETVLTDHGVNGDWMDWISVVWTFDAVKDTAYKFRVESDNPHVSQDIQSVINVLVFRGDALQG